jgi:starch synthase (maltosyl-transferring)
LKPPLVYNLFQRLVGPTTRWPEHARRARGMGFEWLYLNPWHEPGFSGSLYAVKHFDRLNPAFVPAGADPGSLEPLRDALAAISELGMRPVMDLIVNHASKDSPLIERHPGWFPRDGDGRPRSPFVVDPDDPTKVTVWGDLAEIDNLTGDDREGLWRFWAGVVRRGIELGFTGFRCDAAYMVPAELWRFLIGEARAVAPDTVFFAETLGAPADQVLALKEAGFDFFFNSSKWWDFAQPWALDQHAAFGAIAPSLSFPETHDTERLAAETGGDEGVQRQRYAFAAAFSAGVMMPVGYEFGFRRRVDVVRTVPTDWERRAMDLRPFVSRVNRLKLDHPVLHGEGRLSPEGELGGDTLALRRDTPAGTGWILVNRCPDRGATVEPPRAARSTRLFRVCRDDAPEAGEPVSRRVALRPSEVAYLLPAEATLE